MLNLSKIDVSDRLDKNNFSSFKYIKKYQRSSKLLKVSFVLLLFPQGNQASDIFQQFLLFLACLYFTFQAPSSLEGYLANTGFTKALDTGVKAAGNISKIIKVFK